MAAGGHKTPRMPPLDRFSGLRVLGARCLRAVWRGEMEPEAGSKIMNMIRVQGELLQAELLEKRLDALEQDVSPSGSQARAPMRFNLLRNDPDKKDVA